jgi:hypothetical protein
MNKEPIISVHAEKATTCISCGDLITVNYCPNCGEKKLSLHDLKVKHYVEESFEGFTHFDNKFFKSAKLLISRPGALSEKFCQGERVQYMRPFALFFVCNILFFLFSKHNVFSAPFSSFYNFWPFTEFHTQELIDKIAPTEDLMRSVSASFNEQMRMESKAFLAILIPLLAIGGIMLRRKRYLSEHLVFSTHYFAFILLYFTVLDLVISKPVSFFMKEDYNEVFDTAKGLLTLLVIGCYYCIAARRFYAISVLKAVFGSMFMMALFLACLYGYKLLLFFKIIRVFDV